MFRVRVRSKLSNQPSNLDSNNLSPKKNSAACEFRTRCGQKITDRTIKPRSRKTAFIKARSPATGPKNLERVRVMFLDQLHLKKKARNLLV